MKNSLLIFVLILLPIVCTLFFLEKKEKKITHFPGAANEENQELRAEWERMLLADPATGEVPAGIKFLEQQFAARLPHAGAERSSSEWVQRGPFNLGGRTRSLAIDVTNENRILAGGVSGGLWLSENGGLSWSRKTPLNAHPSCVGIAQDTRPGHTDTWYYIAGEVYGNSASGGGAFYLGDGMFKSTDGGESWLPVDATDNGSQNSFSTVWQAAWKVITYPHDTLQEVVFAATYGAIFRSTDGGTSWTIARGSTNQPPYFTDIATTSSGILYATLGSDGLYHGVWRSTDGVTWTNITPTNFPAAYGRIVIGINPNNENEVYFLGATPGTGHYNLYFGNDDWSSLWKYSYISGDGAGAGGTWEDRSMNLPDTGTEFDRFTCQRGYNLVVRVQPGTNHVFIGGTSIYRSTDGFATPSNTAIVGGWNPGTSQPFFELYPNHHPDIHDLLFLPSSPNVMLSASDGGLHRTDDCNAANVSWASLNNGYQTTQLYTAIFDKYAEGDNVLIAGMQDNGCFFVNSSDPAAIWNNVLNGDGGFGEVAPDKAYYVLSIQRGRVAKCDIDEQGNLTAFQRIDPVGREPGDYLFINPLAIDPNAPDILYLPSGDRLFRQDSLGAIPLNNEWDNLSTGWTELPDTLTPINDGMGQHVISAIGVSQANPANRVYIGTSRNKIYRIDDANIGAPSFVQLTSPLSTSGNYINCIAVDPDNADHIILVYSNYNTYSIFRSLNGGLAWEKVGGNLEASLGGSGNAPSIRWISILPLPGGAHKYFCGTSVGLFSADSLELHTSSQAGTQWLLEAPDLIGTTVVPYVGVRTTDGMVVAASHGNGIFSANFFPSVGTKDLSNSASIPVRVWPNPAQDYTTFQLPGISGETVLAILYNQHGKPVRRAEISSEHGKMNLDGLSAGIYFYELSGKSWKKSGKMMRL